MIIAPHLNPTLPPLAWLASIKPRSGVCRVEHGRLVEIRDDLFVEGVWPGTFLEGGFDRCEAFFGSGAVLRSDTEIVFVPSSATVDYLYHSNISTGFMCSNSLPYLLAAGDDELDEFNPEYNRINKSIVSGIDSYLQRIPTKRGSVSRLMYYNLVYRDGLLRQEHKLLPPEFSSFEQYRDYLVSNLSALMRNGRDMARKTPLRILSTQSSGYDSTAINEIACRGGLDLALSCAEPKESKNYFKHRREFDRPNNSGEQICYQLGIQMSLIDRRYFLRDPSAEKLYWAGVHRCQDLNLHEVSKHVGEGSVLLTGALGEIWNNAKSTPLDRLKKVNDQLERWDLSCHSLSEVRLHIGYVHAPAPFIGARSRRSIFDISNSEGMQAWSLGNAYDRPIARRLGEEAGVSRQLFGQTKLASVVENVPPFFPIGRQLDYEFSNFIRKRRGRAALARMKMLVWLNSAIIKLQSSAERLPDYLGKRLIGEITRHIPLRGYNCNAILYAYCVNSTQQFYASSVGHT